MPKTDDTKMFRECFTIKIPGNLSNDWDELADHALHQAREEADTHVIPCKWSVGHISGKIGDHEITFRVIRISRRQN